MQLVLCRRQFSHTHTALQLPKNIDDHIFQWTDLPVLLCENQLQLDDINIMDTSSRYLSVSGLLVHASTRRWRQSFFLYPRRQHQFVSWFSQSVSSPSKVLLSIVVSFKTAFKCKYTVCWGAIFLLVTINNITIIFHYSNTDMRVF